MAMMFGGRWAEIACNPLIKPIHSAKNKRGKYKNKQSKVFRGSLYCVA
jgi:hypothetical protein